MVSASPHAACPEVRSIHDCTLWYCGQRRECQLSATVTGGKPNAVRRLPPRLPPRHGLLLVRSHLGGLGRLQVRCGSAGADHAPVVTEHRILGL